MKPVLLLIDDNEEILEFLEHELIENYTVIKALNGKDALTVLKGDAIQLIICDIMMPVKDGFELCKIIKTSFEYSHISIILLTARNTM
jgi:CheY-like chemotaxis protein